MGFLKKIFKPVSKVLDKIVPNEIKPALPYLSAFAPMMLGPGIMGSSMLHRGLMSGGLNLLGQLSQEGSEGDANLLSTLMAGGIGALTAPGSKDLITRNMHPTEGVIESIVPGTTAAQDSIASGIAKYGKDSAMGDLLTPLGKASKFLTDPGLVKYGIPAAQGTMDLAYADAVRQQRDLESDQASDDGGGEDANRALAIRQSMEAYGFTEEEILDAIAAAGYKAGGRVGIMKAKRGLVNEPGGYAGYKLNDFALDEDLFNMSGVKRYYLKDMSDDGETYDADTVRDMIYGGQYASGGRVALAFGGIDSAVEKVDDVEIKENIQFAQNMDMPMEDLVEEFMIIHKRKPNSLDELKRFYKDKYEYKGPADVKMKETMTERFTAKDGGMMSVLPRGKEMDYRDGGMIPIGSKEKADDVPARLSKNEFVMTADAVRAAGGGSVNEGARRMYNLMNNLEARA